jgi:hypothetical protein
MNDIRQESIIRLQAASCWWVARLLGHQSAVDKESSLIISPSWSDLTDINLDIDINDVDRLVSSVLVFVDTQS